MPDTSINFPAVLTAVVVSFVLGGLWYGPVFGKTWMKLMGWTKESMDAAKKKGMAKSYFLMLVGTFLTAYILDHFLSYASAYNQAGGIKAGLQIGFWIWLGFIAPIIMGAQLWEGKSWKLFVLNAGYQLVSLLIMGVILASWL